MILEDVYYLIVTKRNLAIDQIVSKFINGKYRIIIQVAQLNKQKHFWGA